MTRSARWLFAAALLPVAACSSNPPPPAAPPAPPPLAAVDSTFINAAAAVDASEISAAQLAEQKSHNKRILDFAQHMITDHQAADSQLTQLASSKGVTPDAAPNAMEQDAAAKLNAASPRTFNQAYVRSQIAGHMAAVKLFQDEIANGQDADVKAFAQSTLPTIQNHLKMARALSGVR